MKQFQGGAYMEQELAYSFHLGSDKNKSKLAKKVSKGNVSGTTSFQIMLFKMQKIYQKPISITYEIMIIKENLLQLYMELMILLKMLNKYI